MNIGNISSNIAWEFPSSINSRTIYIITPASFIDDTKPSPSFPHFTLQKISCGLKDLPVDPALVYADLRPHEVKLLGPHSRD